MHFVEFLRRVADGDRADQAEDREGDGERHDDHGPAGLLFRERDLQQWVLLSIETSSTANAVPLLLQGEGLNAD